VSPLKAGLEKAIEHGLQLAILNSCDGLKLAEDLADLNIPQVIVMREPVPDRAAQQFLKFFLKAFSSGESLYLAVRQARKRLHETGWDDNCPGVSWLPVIYQNPTVGALNWSSYLEPPRETTTVSHKKIVLVFMVFILFGIPKLPMPEPVPPQPVNPWYSNAMAALENGHKSNALEYVNRGLKKTPKDAGFLTLKIKVLLLIGGSENLAEARKVADQNYLDGWVDCLRKENFFSSIITTETELETKCPSQSP
jgi:hypothetical protein